MEFYRMNFSLYTTMNDFLGGKTGIPKWNQLRNVYFNYHVAPEQLLETIHISTQKNINEGKLYFAEIGVCKIFQ